MSTANPNTLQAAFAARNEWHANRSSAIFALRLRNDCDLIIAYLNYWRIKNNIDVLQRVVRLYDSAGALAGRYSHRVNGNAQVSIREHFAITGDFDGMVEVEFLSPDNLRFPFPAVQGFYRAGDAFSAVHSAGRIKNADEADANAASSVETNWICKFAPSVTPFFHVFRPGTATVPTAVQVDVLGPDGQVLLSKRIDDLASGPFSSATLLLDEVFPELWKDATPPPKTFCRVTVPQVGIFPRLVVGNLFRDNDLLEVTHSFPSQRASDYVVVPEGTDLASFLPAIKTPDLDLRLWSFPTNCVAQVEADVRLQQETASHLMPSSPRNSWRTGGEGSSVWTYDMPHDTVMASLDLRGNRVPARLNVSYQFSVHGAASRYSTDIATGAKSCAYPPKHSHWGSGIVGRKFRMILMARNMSHTPSTTKASAGTLKLWVGDSLQPTQSLSIGAEAGSSWSFDSHDVGAPDGEISFVHWLANFDQPSVEMFWVSCADDGRICGDHAF